MENLIHKIREYFPVENLVIRQGYDPEFDRSAEVDMFIQSSDCPDKVFDTLKRFDHEYWLDNLDEFKGLNIWVEFARSTP